MHEAMNGHDRRSSRVVIDGQLLEVTDLFETYWYLAAERQAMFFRRVEGRPAPWTQDSILRGHRFTNVYRASDRVSQYLMQRVIYNDDYDVPMISCSGCCCSSCSTGSRHGRTLSLRSASRRWRRSIPSPIRVRSIVGSPPTSGCTPRRTSCRAHNSATTASTPNHLHLLDQLIRDGTLARLATAPTLAALYDDLRAVPSFGPFLAFQYAIDLNYSECFDFDEMDFVVPGPGALRGISKCFASTGGLDAVGVIRAVANSADRFLSEHSFREPVGPAAAADRLPEPVLRGRQVRPGVTSAPLRRRPDPDQTDIRRRPAPAQPWLPAEVGTAVLRCVADTHRIDRKSDTVVAFADTRC